jgi:hypothetical protein
MKLLRTLVLLVLSAPCCDSPYAQDVVTGTLFPRTTTSAQPLKGWAPYTTAGKIHQPYSMVFLYASWKELEPVEGQFEFEKWEKEDWAHPQAKGKHVIFRVYLDYPTKESGIPSWLLEKGVETEKYSQHGGGITPNYNHPEMRKALANFIAALGARYNLNPRVAFIQLGLLGHWGEWHTYPQVERFADHTTTKIVVAAYRKAFPDKMLMARYPRGYAATPKWLGFHDDLFPADTQNGKDWAFLTTLKASGQDKNWKVAPIGGEMEPFQAKKWMVHQYGNTRKALLNGHFSWVGPYCPALVEISDKGYLDHCKELIQRMGYDFQIRTYKHNKTIKQGDPLRLFLTGANQGIAPFYYKWPVRLVLIDGDGKTVTTETDLDIRRWGPGEFKTLLTASSNNLSPGLYRLGIGVIDPWTKKPRLQFSSKMGLHKDGWQIFSNLEITK